MVSTKYVETKYTYTTNLHKDSDECTVTELSGLVVAGKVFAWNVHDECALLLIRLTTSPFRLVINTICCNMLKSSITVVLALCHLQLWLGCTKVHSVTVNKCKCAEGITQTVDSERGPPSNIYNIWVVLRCKKYGLYNGAYRMLW